LPVAHWPTGTSRKYCIKAGFLAEVERKPPLELTEKVADEIKDGLWNMLVGLGGGSSIDVTKVAALFAINHDSAKSFVGVNKVPKPVCFSKTRFSGASKKSKISKTSTKTPGKKRRHGDHLIAPCLR
jgi:alcohol dehydrogenase YqhD (iron-dependent ADH family)